MKYQTHISVFYSRMCSLFFMGFTLIFAIACGGSGGALSDLNSLNSPISLNENLVSGDATVTSGESEIATRFKTLSDEEWNTTAVEKVMQCFAYGGFASDEQVLAWADMSPQKAIVEILNFEATNAKLAPGDEQNLYRGKASLKELGAFWSSNDPSNPTPQHDREHFDINRWNSPAQIWLSAVGIRGLNPFRLKMGLWESNDHLAVNMDAGVNNHQAIDYFDAITESFSLGKSYQNILADAAASAAIATQYNHRKNRFEDGKFEGNEDFAREFHQLFFGILGNDDPQYHEQVSIRNTAKALTDIRLEWIHENDSQRLSHTPVFGMEYHYPADLEILGQSVSGDTAREKIQQLAEEAIAHPECLDNLPVKIIQGLADENLDENKRAKIRQAWADMPEKDLLNFIRDYAISTVFHNPSRVKHMNELERQVLIANKLTLDNDEAHHQIYRPSALMWRGDNCPFRPSKNVFGSITGLEASQSIEIFNRAYQESTQHIWHFMHNHNSDRGWIKDWSKRFKGLNSGFMTVRELGEKLWRHLISDGGKHFGLLEQSQVYTLLATGMDYSLFVDDTQAERVYSLSELQSSSHQERLHDLGISRLRYQSDQDRIRLNKNIGKAAAFIVATPYSFLQEGI